jgi:hypothetical protein
MKTIITLAIVLSLAAVPVFGDETTPPPIPSEEQPEVLTRGPVNEAFAEPIDLDNEEGIIAPQEPPAPIIENIPDERPSGDQFVWVPGYWAWDTDRNGYIWVSGCWRAAPPGMSWMPGYWSRVTTGWQWVAGFWTPVGAAEIEYLPAPPVIVNVEPVIVAPAPDMIWVPPCWYWRHNRYVLRSGYWLAGNPDWVWTPSHYVWTPRGYIFVRGHWDYALHRRGVLFAPVYFPRNVYIRPGFSYSLSVVVDIGAFQFSWFSCPRYSHYYFGDYYDDVYISIGIFPRYECERRHGWYDPIYYHDKWRHYKDVPKWEEHERHEYGLRRNDKDLRPPRTYRELETRLSKMPEAKRGEIRVAEPINTVVREKKTAFKFEQVNLVGRQRINNETTEVRKFRDERSQWESKKGQKQQIKEQPMEKPQLQQKPQLQEKEQKAERQEMRPQEKLQNTENKQIRTQEKEQKVQAPSQSERVKVPPSPLTEKRGVLSIFRKGPPSRPSNEQKVEVKDTPKERSADNGRDNSQNKNVGRGGDNRQNSDAGKGRERSRERQR